jgi:hypothetical protein
MQVGNMGSENDVTTTLYSSWSIGEIRNAILVSLIHSGYKESILQSIIHPNDNFSKEILSETLCDVKLCTEQLNIAHGHLRFSDVFHGNVASENKVTTTLLCDFSHTELRHLILNSIPFLSNKESFFQSMFHADNNFSKKTLEATLCDLKLYTERLNIACDRLDVASRAQVLN